MSPLETSFGAVEGAPRSAPQAAFETRHIGLNPQDVATMLAAIDVTSLETLLGQVVPGNIRRHGEMNLPAAVSEAEALDEMRGLAAMNKVRTSLIGMGYYGCHTPPVILRNVLENPAWYTAYTRTSRKFRRGVSRRSSISRRWWSS